MRKLKLLFACLLMAVLGIGQMWATDVEFTPGNSGGMSSTAGAISGTKSGITISISNGVDNGNDIRVYKNATMTITSTVGDITNIVFTFSSSNNGGWSTSYTPNATSWTSSAATGTQARCTSITVTYSSGNSYTITPASNNDSYGTVSLSGNVITATPETGYRVSTSNPYSVSPDGSATVVQSGNAFTVTPSANTTVTINFEAIPTYTVTLKDDNSTLSQASAGATITLPSREGCVGYTFAGWTKTWTSVQASWTTAAPTIITAGSYTPTADENLYPVYTKTESGGEPTSVSGGDMSSGVTTSWTTSGTGTYAGNGVKFDSENDYVQSPDLSSNNYTSLTIKLTAGHNGGSGSVLTIASLNESGDVIDSKDFTPTEAYNDQSDVNSFVLSGSDVIKFVRITMASKTKNLGMAYCEIFTSASTTSYISEPTCVAPTCENLGTPVVTVPAANLTYNSARLTWAAVTNADKYLVKFNGVDQEATSNLYFDATGLTAETQYTYQVKALAAANQDAYCDGAFSAEANFTTETAPTAHLTLVDIDGTHASSGDYAILTPFNLPTTAAACAKTFVGWDANENCATAPTYAKGAEFTFANTTGVTLYAVYADAEGGNTDVEFDVEDYADANNWSNSVAYTDFTINGVNFKANGGGNNGKYYTSDHSWRMYNGGSVVLTAASGNIIAVSSTPSQTFTIENGSASLSLSATVKFTAITVTVAADAVYSNYSTTCAEKTATPTFTLAAGTYTTAQTVGITCATDGATIYYTTDGTDPTTSSTEYTAAISLSERGETTIKAIAVKAGAENSDIATAAYNINLPFASVTELFTYLDANSLTTLSDVTVTGVVSNIATAYDGSKITIDISDDGQTTGNQLRGYKTIGTAAAIVAVGDRVTLTGN
ncbi:MAG: chitobiase/beta-hexosaminidase C-terminal domain-containing protein, partial [Paludibacteraceae bacterium]|nr:chitobiase/beta-hexosaminidase C-terminal domain-containing protein [Paludibacteraceae bacterium]